MSKIKNGELHQYGIEASEQQQFGTAGIEGVNWVQQASPAQRLISCHATALAVYVEYSSSIVAIPVRPLMSIGDCFQQ